MSLAADIPPGWVANCQMSRCSSLYLGSVQDLRWKKLLHLSVSRSLPLPNTSTTTMGYTYISGFRLR